MNLSKIKHKNIIVAFLIFLIFVVVDSVNLSATGMLWDELAVATYGESYIGYLGNLDFNERHWSLNDEHPPLGKYIYGIARKITKRSSFLTNLDPLYDPSRALTFARFFSVLMGGLTVSALFLLGATFFNFNVGIFSAFILAISPHFLAYTRIASLETPLLLFSVLFVSTFLLAVKGARFRDSNTALWILSSIFLGCSLASRFNGAFLFLLYEAGLLLFYRKNVFKRENIWKIFLPVLSFLFLYIIWPWLWRSPVRNFYESIDRGFEVHTKEYFLGRWSFTPFYYYFVYFLATTPILLLFMFLSFLFKFLRDTLKKEDTPQNEEYPQKQEYPFFGRVPVFMFLYFLTPFLASFFPLKQDGIRYVQSFLPAFAVISALGLNHILNLAKSREIKIAFLGLTIFAGISIPYKIYPYYLDYYNNLFGSLNSIVEKKLFELGWWGEGSMEAVTFVNNIIKEGDTIFVDFAPGHTVPAFKEGVKVIKNRGADPDFIIVNLFSRWYGDGEKTMAYAREQNYKLLYEVKVAHKVPIVWVFSRK